MDDKKIVIMFIIFVGAYVVISYTPRSDSIPPLPSFSKITINGETFEATNPEDELIIDIIGSIGAETIQQNHIEIKLKETNCPLLLAVTGVDEDGEFECL